MNTAPMLRLCLGMMCLVVPALDVSSQGELTPPGAPAPVFKTLAQVEPRIPIEGGSGLGSLIIRQPGSYYLTGNRQTSGTAIFIRTNGVTIDLNGYGLLGGGSNEGILGEHTDGRAIERVVICNGTISGFTGGIHLVVPRACRIENVICSSNAGTGIQLEADTGSVVGNVVKDCQLIGNGGTGIYLQGGSAPGDVCSGNIISRCTMSGSQGRTGASNTGYGFWMFGSSAPGSGGSCGNLIEYCAAASNLRIGFLVTASSARAVGNRFVGCVSSLNGGTGFEFTASSVGQMFGNSITECQAVGNGSDGFRLAGISNSAGGNQFSRNQAVGNGGRGFSTSGSVGGLTIANFAMGNTNGNYLLAATDSNGPLVTSSGTLANTGNDAHYGANISR